MMYVGSLSDAPDRDGGWIRAFESLGWQVTRFVSDVSEHGPAIWQKTAKRFQVGRAHRQMRQRLIELCQDLKPAWVHFRLPLAFTGSDIAAIRATGAIVTEYFNDDPFSPRRVPGLHRKFLRALPAYDAHFVYRRHNVLLFQRAGARHVEHCPPALDDARFDGMVLGAASGTFDHDATFIGHFENDGRLEYMEALQEDGFKVAVHGAGWGPAVLRGPLQHLYPAAPVFGTGYGQTYARSLCGLCFFSKLNRDTWTERPLEIIAVGGLLVCERSEEAMTCFKDGEEALFFSSPQELLAICRKVKADPQFRQRVRDAGYARLMRDDCQFLIARARKVSDFARSQSDPAQSAEITRPPPYQGPAFQNEGSAR
jgi:hypothetical protein